jgi:hypothetical protein
MGAAVAAEVELKTKTGGAIDVPAGEVGTKSAALTLVRPIAKPAALVEAHKEVSSLIANALEKDRDYGTVPGTNKPTLLKPGAERLALAFGAVPKYAIVEQEREHDRAVPWTKQKKIWANKFKGDRDFTYQVESGESLGLYRYVVRCTLVQRETDVVLGEGLASCSTLESKYIDRPRDCENTTLKMAQKRAFVAAVLNAFALSDRFTQDVEEVGPTATAMEHDDGKPKTALEIALDLPLPGKETSFDGWGRKPLGSVPSKVLRAAKEWLEKKLAGAAPDAYTEANKLAVDGMTLILEARNTGDLDEPPAKEG